MKYFSIYFIQKRIMPYRIPLFDRLEDDLEKNKIFKVFGKCSSNNLLEKLSSRNYIKNLNKSPLLNSIFPKALLSVWKDQVDIVVTEASPRNFILLIYLCLFKKKETIHIGWSKITTQNIFKGLSFYLYKKYISFFYNKFDHLFVYGKESLNSLDKLGFNSLKVSIIQNAIEASYRNLSEIEIKKYLKKYNLSKKRRRILVLGRMEIDKRPNDILKIWDQLSYRYPDLDLYFAGDGPLLKKIKKEVATKNFKHIYIIGKVGMGVDNLLIDYSTICLQQGAPGLAINQAMLLKTSVIIADEKGPDTELISHKETGLRYEKANISELYKSILEILDNNIIRKEILNRANLKVNKIATIDKMAKSMISKFVYLRNN